MLISQLWFSAHLEITVYQVIFKAKYQFKCFKWNIEKILKMANI